MDAPKDPLVVVSKGKDILSLTPGTFKSPPFSEKFRPLEEMINKDCFDAFYLDVNIDCLLPTWSILPTPRSDCSSTRPFFMKSTGSE